MTRRLALAAAVAMLAAACSPVMNKYVRPDYEKAPEQQVKRLVVVTQPLPAGDAKLGELWGLITRQWVNQNRDYLVKQQVALAERPSDTSFKAQCIEGIEGVLWLEPTVQRKGGGVEAEVKARMVRCADGQDEWHAETAGSWGSQDDKYRERAAQYVQQFGPEVEPYVIPSYKLLKATFETLPHPKLSEADIEEKIELGE